MNRRQITLIVIVVVILHAGVFWLLGGSIRALPPRRFPAPPQDDLRLREARFEHPETGEPMVYREIRVSTRLALPDVLMESRDPSPRPAGLPLAPSSFPPPSQEIGQ